MTVAEQARMFAAMALCGMLCGAVYDAMAIARHALRLGAFGAGALDLLFGACCAGAMIAGGLLLQAEPFRLYAFGGMALGLALYALTIGTVVRVLIRGIRRFVKKS